MFLVIGSSNKGTFVLSDLSGSINWECPRINDSYVFINPAPVSKHTGSPRFPPFLEMSCYVFGFWPVEWERSDVSVFQNGLKEPLFLSSLWGYNPASQSRRSHDSWVITCSKAAQESCQLAVEIVWVRNKLLPDEDTKLLGLLLLQHDLTYLD